MTNELRPATPEATAAPPAEVAETLAEPARRRVGMSRWRRGLLVLAPILVVVAAWVAYVTYREGALYVSTDNAQLAGQPVQVGSINAGRVDTIDVSVGSRAHRGDVPPQVALPSESAPAPAGH